MPKSSASAQGGGSAAPSKKRNKVETDVPGKANTAKPPSVVAGQHVYVVTSESEYGEWDEVERKIVGAYPTLPMALSNAYAAIACNINKGHGLVFNQKNIKQDNYQELLSSGICPNTEKIVYSTRKTRYRLTALVSCVEVSTARGPGPRQAYIPLLEAGVRVTPAAADVMWPEGLGAAAEAVNALFLRSLPSPPYVHGDAQVYATVAVFGAIDELGEMHAAQFPDETDIGHDNLLHCIRQIDPSFANQRPSLVSEPKKAMHYMAAKVHEHMKKMSKEQRKYFDCAGELSQKSDTFVPPELEAASWLMQPYHVMVSLLASLLPSFEKESGEDDNDYFDFDESPLFAMKKFVSGANTDQRNFFKACSEIDISLDALRLASDWMKHLCV